MFDSCVGFQQKVADVNALLAEVSASIETAYECGKDKRYGQQSNDYRFFHTFTKLPSLTTEIKIVIMLLLVLLLYTIFRCWTSPALLIEVKI